ncbi:MAG: threonine/serine dehydratase [Alphaproteobacteria bacterium]
MNFPTLHGIEDALGNIRPHLPATPFVRSEIVSRAIGADVWLKNETTTPIASFKLRGALNAILKAKARGALTGVTTASTGNHGQAVAHAARTAGVPADIFLPAVANPVKAAMIEAFGGHLHKIGHDVDAAKEASRAFAKEHGRYFVDDGDDIDVMEGAGTLGLEIARDLATLDTVFVPVGGANLIGGVATAVKALHKGARIIGVQAKGAPSLYESFRARRHVERPVETLADGLAQRVPPTLALEVMIKLVDDMLLTTDDELLSGVRTIAESAHVLVELAGAAALAGAWQRRAELRGKTVVLILSGANITMELLRRALDREPFISLAGI